MSKTKDHCDIIVRELLGNIFSSDFPDELQNRKYAPNYGPGQRKCAKSSELILNQAI